MARASKRPVEQTELNTQRQQYEPEEAAARMAKLTEQNKQNLALATGINAVTARNILYELSEMLGIVDNLAVPVDAGQLGEKLDFMKEAGFEIVTEGEGPGRRFAFNGGNEMSVEDRKLTVQLFTVFLGQKLPLPAGGSGTQTPTPRGEALDAEADAVDEEARADEAQQAKRRRTKECSGHTHTPRDVDAYETQAKLAMDKAGGGSGDGGGSSGGGSGAPAGLLDDKTHGERSASLLDTLKAAGVGSQQMYVTASGNVQMVQPRKLSQSEWLQRSLLILVELDRMDTKAAGFFPGADTVAVARYANAHLWKKYIVWILQLAGSSPNWPRSADFDKYVRDKLHREQQGSFDPKELIFEYQTNYLVDRGSGGGGSSGGGGTKAGGSSKNPKGRSSTGGGATCDRFNSERGCSREQCKFEHKCKTCGKGGHGAHQCTKK